LTAGAVHYILHTKLHLARVNGTWIICSIQHNPDSLGTPPLLCIANILGVVYSAIYVYRPKSNAARSALRKVVLTIFIILTFLSFVGGVIGLLAIDLDDYYDDSYNVSTGTIVAIAIIILSIPSIHSISLICIYSVRRNIANEMNTKRTGQRQYNHPTPVNHGQQQVNHS